VVAEGLHEGVFANLGASLVRGFIEIGWEVELLVVRGPTDEGVRRFQDIPFRLVGSRRSATSVPALVSYLRAHKHDIVLPLSSIINVPVLTAHRLAREPSSVVVTEHTSLSIATSREAGAGLRMRSLPSLIRRLYPHAAGLVAVSRTAADDPMLTPLLARIPHAVIGNPYTWDAAERASAGEPHAWLRDGDRQPTLLAVGALIPGKGFALLLRALEGLRARGTIARLIIFGEGFERPALERLVSELGLGGQVDLPGYEVNPYPSMRKADAFVLASRIEGSPMVILEAMRLACPIVATAAGGASAEIIRHGESGLIVADGDLDALTGALELVLSDRRRAQALGSEARRRSDDRSPARVARRYADFFARLPVRTAA
jgi:glycosyltransferase involved in cell wall biosynthesis